MMGRFRNKVVIVTGASRGIGAANAIDFAKEGAKLLITGRNRERLNETAQKCSNTGAEVHQFFGDLSNFEILGSVINEAVERYNGIDILVNNAGIGDANYVEQVDVDVYDKMFKANLQAPVFLSKYALPYLKKSRGCIVNVSSVASLIAAPTTVPYSMTKAALDHFTRGFSSEVAPFGVRVNAINPAIVLTRFSDNLKLSQDELKSRMEKLGRIQRLGFLNAHQVSEGILFLCSSEMTTGSTLAIDGGFCHSSIFNE